MQAPTDQDGLCSDVSVSLACPGDPSRGLSAMAPVKLPPGQRKARERPRCVALTSGPMCAVRRQRTCWSSGRGGETRPGPVMPMRGTEAVHTEPAGTGLPRARRTEAARDGPLGGHAWSVRSARGPGLARAQGRPREGAGLKGQRARGGARGCQDRTPRGLHVSGCVCVSVVCICVCVCLYECV